MPEAEEMKLVICVATMHQNIVIPGDISSWADMANDRDLINRTWVIYNSPELNLGVIGSYQKLYETAAGDILMFAHDDLICREQNWDLRVMKEFEDPSVGVLGFGGALRHGHPDLYKTPYKLQNLARYNYRSNVDDAEVHGERFTGSCEAAVIDGFAIIVRRELLDKCGGWQPDKWPPHHLYDYRICCEAHRYKYQVRVVGIRCHHRGGGTAVSSAYHEWCKTTKWGSDVAMHQAGHRLIYDEFHDVLPYEVK
jgi:hypothetical protein